MRLIKWLAVVLGMLASTVALADRVPDCRQDGLRISIIPVKNMSQLIGEYQPLADLLSHGLGMPVRLLHANSYGGVIDAAVSGGTDIAVMGPASYLKAWRLNPAIEPFGTLPPAPGHFSPGGGYYNSLLLVRSDSGLTDIADLRGRRVALNDPVSTSGALVPMHAFAEVVGEPLGSYFSGQVYAGSHDRALDVLLAGKVDAAFVSSARADEYLNRELINKDTLRLLWRSAPIHYDPLVFTATVCDKLKRRIRTLLATPSPELDRFLETQHATRVMPVDHGAYEMLLPLLAE